MHPWRLSGTFASAQGTVRWQRYGQGPPVVLCHGTPWSSYVWRELVAALSPRYSLHVWDMAGYGMSEQRAGQDVSLRAQAETLAALLAHWGLDRPAVVAHDIGGAVALRAHLLHGRRFASLALVDVVALAPWGSPFFRLVRDRHAVFEQLPPRLHEALVRRYIADASHRGLGEDVLDALAAPWLGPAGQPAFYRQIAQADQHDTDEIEGRYGELDLPVRIVWGVKDAWIPVDRAHRLHALIPGSSVRLIERAGHLVQEDAPAELAVDLAGWLTAAD